MPRRELRLKRISRGLCDRCGKPKPNDGYVSCFACRQKAKEDYNRKKQNGLCVDCGKPSDTGECRCSKCKERNIAFQRENRREAKKSGLCIKCCKRPVATGYSKCPECLEAETVYVRPEESMKRKRIRDTKAQKEKRRIARENGICVTCLKRKTEDGHSECPICLAKARKRDMALRRKRGKLSYELARDMGICTRCKKNVATHGKVCESCFEQLSELLDKANATPRSENHFWIQDNRVAFMAK